MEKSIIVDPEKCTGCRICEMICSFQDAFNPYNSKIKIKKDEELGIDLPVLCLHCSETFCAKACPEGAIRRSPEGLVDIDSGLCKDCQACVEACPFGAIRFLNDKILKCDLCAGDPVCVKWCPTRALSFGEVSATDAMVNRKMIQQTLRQLNNRRC